MAGGQGSAPNPTGKAHDAPPHPHIEPPTARDSSARTLRFTPLALVPDCSAQIMVTLYSHAQMESQTTQQTACFRICDGVGSWMGTPAGS